MQNLLTNNSLTLQLPDEFQQFAASTGRSPQWILEQFISDLVPIYNMASAPRPDNYASSNHSARALAANYYSVICRQPNREPHCQPQALASGVLHSEPQSLASGSEPQALASGDSHCHSGQPDLLRSTVDRILGECKQTRGGSFVDAEGNAITPGRYVLSRNSQQHTVKVWEDAITSDLWLLVVINGQEVKQRVDELSDDCVLTRSEVV
jgi:hypothetical protein